MTDTALLGRVRTLREAGTPPKAIARALQLTPAQVAPLIRAVAEQRAGTPPEQAPLVGCWVSPSWSGHLGLPDRPDWPDVAEPDEAMSGICVVAVARERRHGQVNVCGYLVDTFCLGVKNALGPRPVDDGRGLRDFLDTFFGRYDDPLAAPLELAQHLVFGAVDFARGLGFEPHPDFAAAAPYLGPWHGPSDITFGCDGEPLYVQGPYDNPAEVMKRLA